MNDFGEFLRELRGKKSLRETERLTGLSHTYLSSLEKGYDPRSKKPRHPSPEAIKKISDALGYDYFDLMKKAGYEDMANELLNASNVDLKKKVAKFTDEIMQLEIKEMQSEKYKKLYDPRFKTKTIDYLVKHYNFDNLTDSGIKGHTKKLLDEYLDKKEQEKKYSPISNQNSINLSFDGLTLIRNQIDVYFREDNIEINFSDYLKPNEIKENLSYDLYKKIRIILEDAQNEIRKINSEEF